MLLPTSFWKKSVLLVCLSIFAIGAVVYLTPSPTTFAQLPVVFKGRIRPLDTSARLWLEEFYHHQQILKSQSKEFGTRSALDLVWRLHTSGHESLGHAPLFWIENADLKSQLNLDLSKSSFSFYELPKEINTDESTPLTTLQTLMQHYTQLEGLSNIQKEEDWLKSLAVKWKSEGIEPKEIGLRLEAQAPLMKRIANAGVLVKALPGRHNKEWYSLAALTIKKYQPHNREFEYASNFTIYSDDDFQAIRQAYLAGDKDLLAQKLMLAYEKIQGTPFQVASGKSLKYPTTRQLYIETLYYHIPMLPLAMVFYLFGILIYIFSYTLRKSHFKNTAFVFICFAFVLHTSILIARCYILQRAPVSNMFETLIYVPWLAMLLGIISKSIWKDDIVPFAASIVALTLLLVLQVTNINSSLENVQAVLDSQYWLIIHVLLIVGSYGVFALCGVLGHWYLLHKSPKVGKYILQTMYVGCAMLIPGTILGGVWAAESWGRFWDWDPKESWAFISSCIYLIAIHAFTFRRIGYFGLALMSLLGLQAIGFTWYGVNYILGTGLHSYGFGSGGEIYYYGFIAVEIIFVVTILGYRVCKGQMNKMLFRGQTD